MRSYFACSLVIALLVAAGCKDDNPGRDASSDGKVDGTGDGISLSDRADLGGSDRADTGTDTGGGDTGVDTGTDTGTDVGTDAGTDGGDGGGTPTCTDGIKNSDETDIDCGGHCGKCGPGRQCLVSADCTFACKTDKTCADCSAATDCPGTESECEHRTCTAGVCGSMREAAGTAPTLQTVGDCKRRVCTTAGTVMLANDDTDVPDDRNPCTNDVCMTGTPSHTTMPAGSNCGGANTCNAAGQCVGCAVASDCPGSDTPCRTRTCTAGGVCGFSFTAAGTKLVDPTAKDCKGMQCDGNGNAQPFNDDLDLPVDTNPCTTDECNAGTPTHRNVQSGTLCGGTGSSLVCDGASHCVECLTASTCPGTDADCHTRSCVSGQCGVTNLTAGTLIATQTQRDCKKTVCDGQGSTMTANDDLDLPFDNNPCTQDVCTAGTASNPFVTAGNSCGTNTICDGQGACVACISPSTCPGTDADCHHRTCVNGVCGMTNIAAGTAISAQMTGDCKVVQCDGNGQTMMVNDDTDLPVDGNACTGDVCTNGTKSNPNLSTGTVCGTNLMCNGQGACVGCVTAANCGSDSFCQTHTCTNGSCGVNNTAVGTALPAAMQIDKDCKRVQCDGNGQTQTVNDDTDKPVDGNQCTKDVCNAGIGTNPPEDANATCNMSGGTRCNGTGSCVQCLQPTDCPGTDTECHHRACSSTGQCSIVNEADGKLMTGQTPADCKKNVCMNGAPVIVNDDTDVLVDGNGCTMDLCSNGVRSNPPLTAGAACNEDGGTRCNGSTTAPKCVQCLMNSHCGNDDLCKMYTCDSAGQCNTTFVPIGTQVGTQVTGNCRKNVCDGTGSEVSAVDNNDPLVDGNQCTDDLCNGGTPTNPPRGAGAACNQGAGNTMCNGSATAPACVQCNQDDDCGSNTFCKTFHCNAGVCSSTNTQDGTFVSGGGAGDCHKNVCMNGATTSVVDTTDVYVDGNPCTDDVCSDDGTPSNPNKNVGFNCGGSLMCDGAGNCVGCVMDSNCPAAPNVCQVRVCMTGGVCGTTNEPVGSHASNSQVGDCHHDECDGAGNVANVIDDNDKPVDTNPCTQDLCNAGVPSHDFFAPGTTCTDNSKPLATQCDGAGACVECLNASTCPGDDDPQYGCHVRTCLNGACGIGNQPDFTPATTQSASPDCHKVVCNGLGGTRNDVDDSDVPNNTNDCVALLMCMGGSVQTTYNGHGTSCNQSGGRTCDSAGACVLTFNVVRVGDGAALSNIATPVFIEEHLVSTGAIQGSALALPTTEGTPTATDHAFSLTGINNGSTSEGQLSLSLDGKYVVLAGYNRPTSNTTANLPSSTAATTNRMVARVAGDGTINTSTLFGTSAFSGNNVRGVTTIDGSAFWGSGAGGGNAGVWYATAGASTSLQIFNSAIRWVGIFPNPSNQLYGSGNNSPLQNVFTLGSGVPTTAGQTAMTLNGMPTTGSTLSPHGFALFDRVADMNSTLDTLYLADDGTAANIGIQKWSLTGTTWMRGVTMVDPGATPVGFRGLLAFVTGADVTIIGVTSETSGNRIVKFVDTGSGTPTGTVIATAPANTMYRGIALAPHR